MKQIISAIAFLLIITLSKNSGAQSKNDLAYNNFSPVEDISLKSPDNKAFETKITHSKVAYLKATQVDIKAVRHFIRSHKNVSDERWFRTEDGYIANFVSKGIDTRILYDGNGRWLCDLLVYTEDRLPSDIRHRVKSQYYDDDLTEIRQYETRDKTVYIILTKDQQSNTKILKVGEGEMEEITTHEKN
jgi:hypothetical protein